VSDVAAPILLVMMTAPDEPTAETIARILVEERLVACCNLLPQVRSIYRWQGSIEQADEILVLIKTTAAALEAVRARIVELHPYDLPEIIATPVVDGHAPYLDWVRQSTAAE
jgi:periplasmic divalent cation tolerance protein